MKFFFFDKLRNIDFFISELQKPENIKLFHNGLNPITVYNCNFSLQDIIIHTNTHTYIIYVYRANNKY